jgi:hypothetical protein
MHATAILAALEMWRVSRYLVIEQIEGLQLCQHHTKQQQEPS